jgi:hypothetical protein
MKRIAKSVLVESVQYTEQVFTVMNGGSYG